MKKILLPMWLLLCAVPLIAQKSKRDTIGIHEAMITLRKAMLEPSSATLGIITSSNLSYGHSNGAVDDQKNFVQKLVTGQSDFTKLDFTGMQVISTGKVVLVRHQLHAETMDGGKPGEAHLYVLLVWQRHQKRWKLVARQAVKILQ